MEEKYHVDTSSFPSPDDGVEEDSDDSIIITDIPFHEIQKRQSGIDYEILSDDSDGLLSDEDDDEDPEQAALMRTRARGNIQIDMSDFNIDDDDFELDEDIEDQIEEEDEEEDEEEEKPKEEKDNQFNVDFYKTVELNLDKSIFNRRENQLVSSDENVEENKNEKDDFEVNLVEEVLKKTVELNLEAMRIENGTELNDVNK